MDAASTEVLLASIYDHVCGTDNGSALQILEQGQVSDHIAEMALGDGGPSVAEEAARSERVNTIVRLVSALARKDPSGWPQNTTIGPISGDEGARVTLSKPAKGQQKKNHRKVLNWLYRRLAQIVGKDEARRREASALLARSLAACEHGAEFYERWLVLSRMSLPDQVRAELACLASGDADAARWMTIMRKTTPGIELHRLLLTHLVAEMGVSYRQPTGKQWTFSMDAFEQSRKHRQTPLTEAIASLVETRVEEARKEAGRHIEERSSGWEDERRRLEQQKAKAEEDARAAAVAADDLRQKLNAQVGIVERLQEARSPRAVESLSSCVMDVVDALDRALALCPVVDAAAKILADARQDALNTLETVGICSGMDVGMQPEAEFVNEGYYEIIGSAKAPSDTRIERRCFFRHDPPSGRVLVRPGWIGSRR